MTPTPVALAPSADDPIVDDAIGWMLLLQSHEASADDKRAFSDWCAADPRHEAAFARLRGSVQGLSRPLQLGLDGDEVRRALRGGAAPARRKALARIAVWAGVGVGVGLTAKASISYLDLDADLDDGSAVRLNACSAASLTFTRELRRLTLRSGSLVAKVAHDVSRPFVVNTPYGNVFALGTSFAVSLERDRAAVSVQASRVRVVAASSGEQVVVEAGQKASFSAHNVDQPSSANGSETAWTDGYFVLYNGTLDQIVDALRPYRTGRIHVSARAARLRASGAFPLDDTDRTLAAIVQALPVTVRRYTDQWIEIDLRS
jgi:transmembrane sensor